MKNYRIELVLNVGVSSAEHADFIASEMLRAAVTRFPGNLTASGGIANQEYRIYNEDMIEVWFG